MTDDFFDFWDGGHDFGHPTELQRVIKLKDEKIKEQNLYITELEYLVEGLMKDNKLLVLQIESLVRTKEKETYNTNENNL